MKSPFIHRDISWLSFNERVLDEAAKKEVPLLERLKFLSIYSSNLDEFYRVRIPAVTALEQLEDKDGYNIAAVIKATIHQQQEYFGRILHQDLLPALRENNICFLYGQPIPEYLEQATTQFFFSNIAAFIQITDIRHYPDFFPENNKIYFLIRILLQDTERQLIVNIPATETGRFFEVIQEKRFIVMLDDIIRANLQHVFPSAQLLSCYSFKITRDAELDLQDEYSGDIAEKIERQISIRDYGIATRLLYDASMPEADVRFLVDTFHLEHANLMSGGRYHNLKDLADFPIADSRLCFTKWPAIKQNTGTDIFATIREKDILLHPPFQSYDTLLSFFNTAAIDPQVTEICITLYRVAGDSRIGHALMNAARNGKAVMVFVELKARFDEANNLRWAKRMKAAGVKIIYSIPGLKVHAKVALVKRKEKGRLKYYGVLATGNFNESTARFYTDHILLTAEKNILRELELLFLFLKKRRKPVTTDNFHPQHLLIAQFNLQRCFLDLIDFEIQQAKKGKKAAITIKLNNLEEETMIHKLYEASQAGVVIHMIVRGICRLRSGIQGLSDNIHIFRIVDRYLEHGRIFIFEHAGNEKIYLGSADWMNRNIHHRIEVCFPVLQQPLRQELKTIINLQLQDNVKAVMIDSNGNNVTIDSHTAALQSQEAIYQFLQSKTH